MQKKVEGQEITLAEVPEGGGAQVIDLMEALRASLEKKPARAKAPEPVPALAARKPAKRAQPEPAAPAARKAAKK